MTPSLILTAAPDFVDLAEEELRRALPDASHLTALSEGVLACETAVPFTSLGDQWRRDPPIFIRHVHPVQAAVKLTGKPRDLSLLEGATRETFLDPEGALVDPELPFSVQSRVFSAARYKPFDVNRALSQVVMRASDAPLDVRAPVQVLSAVVAAGSGYLGLSLAAHNLSDWAGGVHRFARRKGQISRAEFKLLEALHVFQIELPPRGTALDLGAAPGGWTWVLRQAEQFVTAVDPAELNPVLAADKGVRHKRMTAEAYLADDPDRFDLIVNDMRLDARDSARLMVRYAGSLYRHGIALMTFKLLESGRRRVLDHAFNILGEAYETAGARQLFHNRSEITVYLRKR